MPSSISSPHGLSAAAGLGQTQWSRIHRLAGPPAGDPSARRSWEDAWMYLWDTFRPAMLAIVRRMLPRIGGGVVPADEAEDVVQSFLLSCIEHDYLSAADPNLGKFRTFVAVCLRRHTTKYVEHRRRKRRAPDAAPIPLTRVPPGQVDAVAQAWDEAFEEEWVRCLLGAALPKVGVRSRPNEELLRVICESPYISMDGLALRLGTERRKIALRLHRSRKMLAEELWEVVKQTVSSEQELEEERATVGRSLAHFLGMRDSVTLFGR